MQLFTTVAIRRGAMPGCVGLVKIRVSQRITREHDRVNILRIFRRSGGLGRGLIKYLDRARVIDIF